MGKFFRLGAIAAFFTGILTVIQGCSEREGVLFAFLLLVLNFCTVPAPDLGLGGPLISLSTAGATASGFNGTIGIPVTLKLPSSFIPTGNEQSLATPQAVPLQGGGLQYKWTFGDGNMGTGNPVTHVYQTQGSFTVSVTVSNSAGKTRTTSLIIQIGPTIGRIYWADASNRRIMRVNLDGSSSETIICRFGCANNNSNINIPIGIALDLAKGKIYGTDVATRRIIRANLDGSSFENVICNSGCANNNSNIDFPDGIALDLTNGKIYWTERFRGQIMRSNLDGSSSENVICNSGCANNNSNLVRPIGIALDLTNGKIYWANNSNHHLMRSNLDGSSSEDVICRSGCANNNSKIDSPIGIALDLSDGKIYWTNQNTSRLMRSNLDGSSSANVICRSGCTNNNSNIEVPQFLAIDTNAAIASFTSSFTTQPASPTANDQITFQASANLPGNLIYHWAFGDGQIGSSQSPTHTYSSGGNFVVALTVSNQFGQTVSTSKVVSVFKTCLTPPNGLVAWWTGDGNALDRVGASHGTLQNGTSFASGLVDQAFSFDGIDDEVLIGNPTAIQLTKYTVDSWFRLDSVPAQNVTILAKGNAGNLPPGQNFNYVIQVRGTGAGAGERTIQAGFKGTSGANIKIVSSTVVSVGSFYHVALTYDGAQLKLYVNGVLENTLSTTETPDVGADLRIGSSIDSAGSTDFGWHGLIDEVSIYNRALTPAEVQSIFANGSVGKCKV